MGSCNPSSQLHSYKQLPRHTSLRIMSLWKVMTMSQVARQGAQAYEAHAAGRFVWGKEGFKWMSDDKGSCSQSLVNLCPVPVVEESNLSCCLTKLLQRDCRDSSL